MKQNKKGFTLIELLIVVVIIGILAAVAIPKFSTTKEKAYMAAMKTDLRNLATAQEAHAADNSGSYFSGSAVQGTPLQNYEPSAQVTIAITATGQGWHGIATHGALGTKKCAMYVNEAPVLPATAQGEPKCES